MPWNDGILELWNDGFGGMISVYSEWNGSENTIRP
jgi:hypothetical protein